jgi:hypothetical protein
MKHLSRFSNGATVPLRTGSLTAALAMAVLALAVLCDPAFTEAQVAVSITIAPPALPVYEQPPIPAPDYIWTPGYWAYGPDGYFWVPGTWVEPPAVGLLWTPGYWAWNNGVFAWNAGYWGPQIGFYGGVNYGFGYPGHGYEGGYWRGHDFYYNTVVNNVTNVQVRNVYQKNVTNVTVNKVSYVGGPGGLTARPTPQEQQAGHVAHQGPTAAQAQQRETASSRPELRASVNHGKPPLAATPKPNDFSGHPAASRNTTAPAPHASAPVHANDLPKPQPRPPVSSSASAEEQAAARQQSQMDARHEQERTALAQKQQQDHAQLSQQHNNDQQATAAMERQHQQQTGALQQRQSQERQAAEKPPAPQQAHSAPEKKPPDRSGG